MQPPVPVDVEHLPELLADLDRVAAYIVSMSENESVWTLRQGNRWSVGQHVEHVARSLALTALAFERAADALDRGELAKRPWRDPVQAVFVLVVTGKRFPRGGRAPASARPGPSPDRPRAMHDISEGVRRHRQVADRLLPEPRDRIWIWNPFVPKFKWHYTLPEMVRVHKNHVEHHFWQASDIIGDRS